MLHHIHTKGNNANENGNCITNSRYKLIQNNRSNQFIITVVENVHKIYRLVQCAINMPCIIYHILELKSVVGLHPVQLSLQNAESDVKLQSPTHRSLGRSCPTLNLLAVKLFNLNFHPLEAVFRRRDPQLQVSENYSDLTKWRSKNFKSCLLM